MKILILLLVIPLFVARSQESQPALIDSVTGKTAVVDTASNPIVHFETGLAKFQTSTGPFFGFTFYTSLAKRSQLGLQVFMMKFERSITYPDATTYDWHPAFLISPTYIFPGKNIDYAIGLGVGAIIPFLAVVTPSVSLRYKVTSSLNATATLRDFFSYRDSTTSRNKIVAYPLVLSIGIQLTR